MVNAERAAMITRKIHQLQADEADIAEAIVNLKAKLIEELGNEPTEEIVGDNDTGFVKVLVYRHKAFNESFGKKNHPELWEKAKKTKEYVDSASAKAALSEEEYALFQKPSLDLSVRLEVLNND